jgi:hypothetical protein
MDVIKVSRLRDGIIVTTARECAPELDLGVANSE